MAVAHGVLDEYRTRSAAMRVAVENDALTLAAAGVTTLGAAAGPAAPRADGAIVRTRTFVARPLLRDGASAATVSRIHKDEDL